MRNRYAWEYTPFKRCIRYAKHNLYQRYVPGLHTIFVSCTAEIICSIAFECRLLLFSCVGSNVAFEYEGPNAKSGQVNGTANINISKLKVSRFEVDTDFDLPLYIARVFA